MVWTAPESRPALLAVALAAAAFGLLYAVAEAVGQGRRVALELIGMAGLSLSAPVMAVAAGVPVRGRALAVAALAFSYFASSLAFVRAYGRLREETIRAVLTCLLAHLALAAGLGWLVVSGRLSGWALAAFAPVLARAVWGMARPPRNLRGLGLREIWVATSFAAIGLVGLAF